MKIIDSAKIAAMTADAAQAPRRRTHATLHDELSDPIQRVVIALQPGTYVRPHRHAAQVWELFAVLEGALAVLIFAADGTVERRVELHAGGARMVQVPPGQWHSIACLAPDTLAFEVKPGPYRALSDKDFAAWAPAETETGAAAMARWLETAREGDRPGAP